MKESHRAFGEDGFDSFHFLIEYGWGCGCCFSLLLCYQCFFFFNLIFIVVSGWEFLLLFHVVEVV